VKFAVNRGRIELRYVVEDPPPLPFGSIEQHPYGCPPREMRPIWVANVASLEELLEVVARENFVISISNSGYWSGKSIEAPGKLMFGIAVFDDWESPPDARDLPIEIVQR